MPPPPLEILEPKIEPKIIVPDSILEKEEVWMKSIWDEIQEANANREGKEKAPIVEINLQKEQLNLDIASRYQEKGPTTSR